MKVSIHAPRVGRDSGSSSWGSCGKSFNPRAPRGARRQYACALAVDDVSIHAPRVGRDVSGCRMIPAPQEFQSTRPAWGATKPQRGEDGPEDSFNPRAPRGARPAPIENLPTALEFQSTRPAWGATSALQHRRDYLKVSIHAPRVGRDGSTVAVLVSAS